jgi:hypothetical protein
LRVTAATTAALSDGNVIGLLPPFRPKLFVPHGKHRRLFRTKARFADDEKNFNFCPYRIELNWFSAIELHFSGPGEALFGR